MSTSNTNIAYQGISGSAQLVSLPLPALKPDEILLKITHTGLCGTDLHAINYGSVIGHEGAGVVVRIGSSVTAFRIGDRAGGGFLRNSCGNCKYCLTGQEIWCHDRDIFLETNSSRLNGTLATYYIGVETFLYKIPEGMQSEHAAPLMCAGATVYAALVKYVKAGDRVGVVGIGGLGHLAIQFASKMGAEVVVFSSTGEKEGEAKAFGAGEFVLSGEPGKVSSPVDVLLLTGSGYPDWEKFLVKNVLARQGVIVPLTAASTTTLPPMLFDGYSLVHSLVANRKVHRDMLEFAAYHQIKPTIEKFELTEDGVKAAIGKLEAGTMRYRGVLVAA